MRDIAQKSNASVIGITESKLDSSILDSEIKIEGYDVIRCDRNRHGGGVACYVKNDICFNQKMDIFSSDIENILFDILLPNSQSITVGILYRPPSQANFIENIQNDFNKLNISKNEVFILGETSPP